MEKECEGFCDPHEGPVVRVLVTGGMCGEKGLGFRYCQAAIAEDRRRGFEVTIITE